MITHIVSLRNAKLDPITSAIGASGLLRIFDGTPPANASAALVGNTTLATLPLSATAAPAAASGALTMNAITTANAVASGTATFFRLLTSGGVAVAQGTVGTTGTDLIMTTVTIISGSPVSVSSMVINDTNT